MASMDEEVPQIISDTVYDVVLADPPWRYTQPHARGSVPYPTLSIDALKRMAIPARQDRAVCFMWAPPAKLPEALQVLEAWGFEYKTCWMWVKTTRTGKLAFGGGYWGRACNELLLIGTRAHGAFSLVEDHTARSVFLAEATGHSRKPAVARDRIRALFGSNATDMKFLELFARPDTECPSTGWHQWGNEVAGFPRVQEPEM